MLVAAFVVAFAVVAVMVLCHKGNGRRSVLLSAGAGRGKGQGRTQQGGRSQQDQAGLEKDLHNSEDLSNLLYVGLSLAAAVTTLRSSYWRN